MKELTVIIVSKDDDDVIAGAIKSAKGFAGDIIVVDGNSSNITAKVCDKLGVRVIKHAFKDFSDQRNVGILYATTKWVLYLDSDELLTEVFKKEVEEKIQKHEEYSPYGGYFIHRKTFYYGHDWNFTDRVQRLFLRSRFIEWRGIVHETPSIKGEFGEIYSPIIHLTHRNLSQMVRKTNEWSEYEAKLRFDAEHPKLEVWRFLRVMMTEFVNSYIKNKGYKNGTYGLIEAMYQAFSIFITYAKLWEMQEKTQKKH
jgi:glycosyltransferase involved in cell wall biosynthesis